MYKLLIIDDELLVQVGIRSMLDWKDEGIDVIGVASNGEKAYDIIKKECPEIIITDIKMPAMDGIELMKKCKEELEYAPQFIVLTSHEDFNFAKSALKLGAVEYLVKLELDAQILRDAIRLAKKRYNTLNIVPNNRVDNKKSSQEQMEMLFKKIINNDIAINDIFQEVRKIDKKLAENKIIIIMYKVSLENEQYLIRSERERIYDCVINTSNELMNKEYYGYTIAFDRLRYIMIIESNSEYKEESLRTQINKIISINKQYFNVELQLGISNLNLGISNIQEGYLQCQEALKYNNNNKITFYSESSDYSSRLVIKAQEYIKTNIYGDLSLNDVAIELGISSGYLSTLFKKYNNRGFSDYVSRAKIEEAKKILKTNNLKIYEVSHLLGYENAYYFSKVFKKITGITPKKFATNSNTYKESNTNI